MPQLQEDAFKNSLVYILEHNEDGAYGIIVNREMGMELAEVFRQLSIESTDDTIGSAVILNGGPVDTGDGLVLHPSGDKFDFTREFINGLSVSSSRDILEAIAKREPPRDYVVVLGHTGWAAGQLESEVADNAWLTVEASASIIFDTSIADRRQAVCDAMGIDLNKLVGQSGHA